jgi:hypothetical protein
VKKSRVIIVNEPIKMSTITKPTISPELLESLKTQTDIEKQVIVHCCFPASSSSDMFIRIWSSTFLIDEKIGHRSSLIHHENISLFPYWTEVPPMKDYWFTLVFSGLPKSCVSFDFAEIIPQEGGFLVSNIKRNGTDVYRIKLN